MSHIGIVGYGYTASHFAKTLVAKGYRVWGTSRTPAALKHNAPHGVSIIPFERDAILSHLDKTAYLLISTPPTETVDDPSFALLHDALLEKKDSLKWIAYLSSTGVYGDHQGGWVNETSICRAKTTRAIQRLSAEKAWLSLYHQAELPVMAFRLSGIYGPGRSALNRLAAGKKTTVFKSGHYFSRIHVDDICGALYQSMLSPTPGEIINLSDDHPSSGHDVDQFAADLVQHKKLECIPYENASLSPMAQSFYSSNKRVSNAKLKQLLYPSLKHPSYKEGLTSLLLGEKKE